MKKITSEIVKIRVLKTRVLVKKIRSALATIFFFFNFLWLFACCIIFVAAAFENNICSV